MIQTFAKKFIVKLLVSSVLFLLSILCSAATQDCGKVKIEKLLTGPRHGAMVLVSNHSCGSGGWVCLDPDGEVLSQSESDKLYSFMLAMHLAEKPFYLHVSPENKPKACAGYPIVEDART